LDFELGENSRTGLNLENALQTETNASAQTAAEFLVTGPDPTAWDCYACGGTLGVFSQKAMTVLAPFAHRCFETLRVSINGAPYYVLRTKDTLDCLDRNRSIIKVFPHDPGRIMQVDRFRFRKELVPDPIMFVIPEGPFHLFASDGVERAIRAGNLRGFELMDAEGMQ
jgi:hypothetical protein